MIPAYKKTSFWIEFAITFIVLQFSLFLFSRFAHWVEARPGVAPVDPILNLFQPVDVTWLIFGVLYTSLIIACVYCCYTNPKRFFMAGQTYALMVVLRICAMYLLPLDPPPTIIPLVDPLVEYIGTAGKTLTKDLFFSGHTATMCVITFAIQQRVPRLILAFCSLIVAAGVLAQHVHYTVDVFVAVFVTATSFQLIEKIQEKFGWSRSLEG